MIEEQLHRIRNVRGPPEASARQILEHISNGIGFKSVAALRVLVPYVGDGDIRDPVAEDQGCAQKADESTEGNGSSFSNLDARVTLMYFTLLCISHYYVFLGTLVTSRAFFTL